MSIDIYKRKSDQFHKGNDRFNILASPMDLSWNQVEGWLKEFFLLQNGVAA